MFAVKSNTADVVKKIQLFADATEKFFLGIGSHYKNFLQCWNFQNAMSFVNFCWVLFSVCNLIVPKKIADTT